MARGDAGGLALDVLPQPLHHEHLTRHLVTHLRAETNPDDEYSYTTGTNYYLFGFVWDEGAHTEGVGPPFTGSAIGACDDKCIGLLEFWPEA